MHFLNNTILLEKIISKKPYFFTEPTTDYLTWEMAIECINYSVHNDCEYIKLSNFSFQLKECSCIPIIKKMLIHFSQLNPEFTSTAHMYIALSESAKMHGRHKDDVDVLFWQGIGATKWFVEDGNEIQTYILKQNDFIYIPKGVFHNVTSLTPRVGISFGFE